MTHEEAAGEVEQLIDALDTTTDPVERATLLERAAEVFEGALGNIENAFLVLLQAFGEVADDERYGQRLARLAERTGAWDDLLAAYEEAAGEAREGAAPLRRRLAEWYGLRELPDKALVQWRALSALDPDDPQAAAAIEDAYEDAGDYRALVDLLTSRLVRAYDPDERLRLQRRVARLLETRLGAPRDAVRWLGQAWLETGDDGVEAQLELHAESCEAWAELADVLGEKLRQTAPDGREVVGIHLRLGAIFRDRLRESRQAARHYEAAVQLDPENVRAVHAWRELVAESGDDEQLADVLAREAALTGDRHERFKRYVELGDHLKDKLHRPTDAVKAWFDALEARPDDKGVLIRLMDVYSETERWDAAIKVLRKLARIETDPAKQAQFTYAVGIIQRDQLKDHLQAVRTLDKALELDPTMLKAFQAIDEILTDDQDFQRQDRYYRKMLARAAEWRLDDTLVVNLARSLGEINRTRLQNYPEALKAYDIVLKKRPDDAATRAIVTELAAVTGDTQRLEAEGHHLIEADPTRPDGYHLLARLRQKQGEPDAAWCYCQVLSTLHALTPEEQRFYEAGRGAQGGQVGRALQGQDWRLLTWSGKSAAHDALFQAVAAALGGSLGASPKDFGVNPKKDQVDVAQTGTFARVLQYVARALGAHIPPVWHAAQARGVAPVLFEQPGLLVGGDVLQRPVEELVFLLSRALYLVGQQHVLTALDGTAEVRVARLTGIAGTLLQAMQPGARLPFDKKLLAEVNRLPPGALGNSGAALQALLQQGADLGLPAWLDALEHTANRLGLLLSNRLSVALRLVQGEVPAVGPAGTQERLHALLQFAVSGAYLELRRGLGLGIRR